VHTYSKHHKHSKNAKKIRFFRPDTLEYFLKYFSNYKLQVTKPPTLPKVYHAEITRSNLPLFFVRACVHACVRACVCVPASEDKIGGRIQLSFIQVFKPNVQNVHHYSVNIIEVYFQSFLMISVSLELSLHKFTLFYSSCLIWWSVHSCKQYFSNNSRRKNPADLNLVILETTELVFLNLFNDLDIAHLRKP